MENNTENLKRNCNVEPFLKEFTKMGQKFPEKQLIKMVLSILVHGLKINSTVRESTYGLMEQNIKEISKTTIWKEKVC